MVDDDEIGRLVDQLIAKLNASNKVVLLTRKEGEEIKEILIYYQQAKLLKAIAHYLAVFLAAYLAFKADILSWWGNGK